MNVAKNLKDEVPIFISSFFSMGSGLTVIEKRNNFIASFRRYRALSQHFTRKLPEKKLNFRFFEILYS